LLLPFASAIALPPVFTLQVPADCRNGTLYAWNIHQTDSIEINDTARQWSIEFYPNNSTTGRVFDVYRFNPNASELVSQFSPYPRFSTTTSFDVHLPLDVYCAWNSSRVFWPWTLACLDTGWSDYFVAQDKRDPVRQRFVCEQRVFVSEEPPTRSHEIVYILFSVVFPMALCLLLLCVVITAIRQWARGHRD
jgi:hypothetical protein